MIKLNNKKLVMLLFIITIIFSFNLHKNSVFGVKISYIQHATEDYLTSKKDIDSAIIYNKEDIARLSKNQNNINLDLFVNKDNDIFLFHPAKASCKTSQCLKYQANSVYNKSTLYLTNRFHLIKLDDVLSDLVNAKEITMELKNFVNKGDFIYNKLKNLLTNTKILNKVKFESFNTSGNNNDYQMVKKIFPNNFLWILTRNSDNFNNWIKIANQDSKIGLSFEVTSFANNINQQKNLILNNYKNENIAFWTFYDSIKSNDKISQKDFFINLFSSNNVKNLKNIYVMGEKSNFSANLLNQGSVLIDSYLNKYEFTKEEIKKMYLDFLNHYDNGVFVNYQNIRKYNHWRQVFLKYVSNIIKNRWHHINSKVYHTNNSGQFDKFWKTINGKKYYFDSSGVMKTSWMSLNGKKYYFDRFGVMRTSWASLWGKKYYFDRYGVMKTSWMSLKGKKYYFDRYGVMKTSWMSLNGKKYYFDRYGVMKKSWMNLRGKKYYFDSNGFMKKSWMNLRGKKYYFDSNGVMKKSWMNLRGKKYYFDRNGVMKKSWTKIGRKWYHFSSHGVLIK